MARLARRAQQCDPPIHGRNLKRLQRYRRRMATKMQIYQEREMARYRRALKSPAGGVAAWVARLCASPRGNLSSNLCKFCGLVYEPGHVCRPLGRSDSPAAVSA